MAKSIEPLPNWFFNTVLVVLIVGVVSMIGGALVYQHHQTDLCNHRGGVWLARDGVCVRQGGVVSL